MRTRRSAAHVANALVLAFGLTLLTAAGGGCSGTDGGYSVSADEERDEERTGIGNGETILRETPLAPALSPRPAVACGSATCDADERCCVAVAPAVLLKDDKGDKDKDKDKNRDAGAPPPPPPPPVDAGAPPPPATTYACTAAPSCAAPTTIALACATRADCLEGTTCCLGRATTPGVTWAATCRTSCAPSEDEMCTMARPACNSEESCVAAHAVAIGLTNVYGVCTRDL